MIVVAKWWGTILSLVLLWQQVINAKLLFSQCPLCLLVGVLQLVILVRPTITVFTATVSVSGPLAA